MTRKQSGGASLMQEAERLARAILWKFTAEAEHRGGFGPEDVDAAKRVILSALEQASSLQRVVDELNRALRAAEHHAGLQVTADGVCLGIRELAAAARYQGEQASSRGPQSRMENAIATLKQEIDDMQSLPLYGATNQIQAHKLGGRLDGLLWAYALFKSAMPLPSPVASTPETEK